MSHAAILQTQQAQTRQRLRDAGRVLLIQDTTSFNFRHHPATTGLGPLENAHCRGFLAHTTLAVSETGVPLGVLDQQVWVRCDADTGQRQHRHQRPFAMKESAKWIKGLPARESPDYPHDAIVIGDAEAHVYDVLDEHVEQGRDFIVRAADARSKTATGQPLFAAIAAQPVQQRFALALVRRPDRAARTAELELRYATLTLQRPARSQAGRETLTVGVVSVVEPDPPVGETAVHWVLLTSLPVTTVAQAQQIVVWYTYRWLIERFHYVLKSGCKMEDSQLRQVERLERLLAVYSLVAWRLLWLTYQARETPDVSCEVALQPHEWQALYAFTRRTTRVPSTAPSLRQAVRWIGQLGGFLARKGDGEPGVKVLWRGWTRLQDIVQTWLLLHPLPPPDVGNV